MIKINSDNSIFDFINPYDNDNLSKMNGFDLSEFVILLNKYYLSLREKLFLKDNVTFGMELEIEDVNADEIISFIGSHFNDSWIYGPDTSLTDGIEINSPILRDNKETWENIEKICLGVNPFASVGMNSGGHIHIGAHILENNKEFWLNFIKLWSVYENVIFRFLYGEFLTSRPNLLKYAPPLCEAFWLDYIILKETKNDMYDILSLISHKKYQAINFHVECFDSQKFYEGNTIEFRCPNGSIDPVIWQNNINLLVKLLEYSKSSNYNNDIIDNRHNLTFDNILNVWHYDEIYLDQALELSDMIFTNNLDKVYFLRQYLKSFQVNDINDGYNKALKFTDFKTHLK